MFFIFFLAAKPAPPSQGFPRAPDRENTGPRIFSLKLLFIYVMLE